MNALLNLNCYGYQVTQQLSQNYLSGRNTYKAVDLKTEQFVVIKQFRFLTVNDWSGYKAVEREIEALQKLDHPGIPRCLGCFDSGSGICLVQEYKAAQPLSPSPRYAPEEVKQIAVKVLEILVYLQQQTPPIIHRDIKPENILVDEQLNVYLIDFGLARRSDRTAAPSSLVAGTPGFMPPEQLLNRPLTPAADLYGLGATLICLLTGTASTDVSNLIDERLRFNFKPLPTLERRLVKWLKKLVQPNPENRFPDARTALDALLQIRADCKASVPAISNLPYVALALWFTIFCAGAGTVAAGGAEMGAALGAGVGVLFGVILGTGNYGGASLGAIVGAIAGAMGGAVVGAAARAGGMLGIGSITGALIGFLLVGGAITVIVELIFQAVEKRLDIDSALVLLLLTAASGSSLGIGVAIGGDRALGQFALALAGLPLAGIFLYLRTVSSQRAIAPSSSVCDFKSAVSTSESVKPGRS